MTDDQDQDILETGDLDADSGLEDFDASPKRGGLGDAWKTNPMVKLGVVLGGLAVIVGGFMLFGGDSTPLAPSAVITSGQQDLKSTPGEKVSEIYEKALVEVNERGVEDAIRTGNSTIPVPIGPSKGRIEAETAKESAEDPLERWRRIQEERLKKEQQAKIVPAAAATAAAQQPVDPYAAEKQTLSGSMQTQMTSVLEAQSIKAPQSVQITTDDWLEQKRQKENEVAVAAAAESDQNAEEATVEILIEAGRIEYGQLITKADSDVPGPILVQLASGPLAGDRMIGSFQKKDDFLVLNFDTVVHEGVALTTSAVALDPKTASPGVVTDVDHKYFQRIILPAAASFIEGIGGAIGESGTTTVSAGQGTTTSSSPDLNSKQELFKGIEKASEKISDLLDKNADEAEVRVIVAAGTHIGIFFTKEVSKNPQTVAPITNQAAPSPTQQLLLQLAPALAQAPLQQAIQAQQGAIPVAGGTAGR